jgi:DNA-binding response OmpR family regulator
MKTLLIVDDDPRLLRAIIRTLKDRYIIRTAQTVGEALPMIESVDLVLTDYQIDIRRATKLLLRAAESKVPAILMSSSGSAAQVALQHRVPFMSKPFETEALLEKIDKTLRRICLRCENPVDTTFRDGRPAKVCASCTLKALRSLMNECEHGGDARTCKKCDDEEWQRVKSMSKEDIERELIEECGFTREQLDESYTKTRAKIRAMVEEAKGKWGDHDQER